MDSKKLARVLTLSILLTVVSIPFGVVPLIFSIIATVNRDNPEIMETNLHKATKWLKICAIAMVVTYIAVIGFMISLMK